MNSFISDCKVVLRMLPAKVRDEDGNLLTMWEKLGVAWEIICGIITVGPDEARRE